MNSPFQRIDPMNSTLPTSLPQALQQLYREPRQIVNAEPLGGTSLHRTWRIDLDNGERLFLKAMLRGTSDTFRCEYEGLELLRGAKALRLPQPLYYDQQMLLTEYLDFGRRGADWEEQLGRGLAELQRASAQKRFGLERDNYLGLSVQPNGWFDSWCEFWRTQRLGWQLRLWAQQAAPDDPVLRLGEKLCDRLDDHLGEIDEPAVLLHGDLWSGNASADSSGVPVIFDPAVYYGHREAEFGMMRLFGGFGPRVEAAYREVWPWQAGHEERIALYRLYHELNHLNLFGSGYYQQCLATLRALV